MLLEQTHLCLVELRLAAFKSVHQPALLLCEVVMNGAAVAVECQVPQSVHPLITSDASFRQLQSLTTLLDIRIGQQSAVGLINLLIEVEHRESDSDVVMSLRRYLAIPFCLVIGDGMVVCLTVQLHADNVLAIHGASPCLEHRPINVQ